MNKAVKYRLYPTTEQKNYVCENLWMLPEGL